MRDEILRWKAEKGFNRGSEFKWRKVSNGYLDNYCEFINLFCDHLKSNHAKFRAHVVNTHDSSYREYGKHDKETSFYKVYYHLLYHSIKKIVEADPAAKVMILLDDKTNRYPFRLPVLRTVLNRAIKRDYGVDGFVSNVEPRSSSGEGAEPLIQYVDILIGAVGFVRNGRAGEQGVSQAKLTLTRYIEKRIGARLEFDTMPSASFNLWTFDVSKSMRAKKQRDHKDRAD